MAVQINVQANQTALAQSIAQGVAQFNSRLAGQNKLNLQINTRGFTQPLGRITSDLNDFESAMKASNARVLAFGASTAVLGGVAKAFKDIATATIEVEKSITDINRILNLSTGNIAKFSSELFSISKQTAVGFQDAAKAATEFSRQGLSAEETINRTKDALILVRLAGVDSAKAVRDLTAAVNGFSREGLNTEQVLNRIVAVEQAFSVSAQDLTEALSRTGQAAQEAGVDFNQLNALVATAQQNTARGGAVIGNALKTIFTRLQRSETLDNLEKFNVAVRDLEGNILPAAQILQNFAGTYNKLADAQKSYLSEQVAGVYQVNILKALVNDLNNEQGVYNKALRIGVNATNEANLANEQLNKTLSALLSQTSTSIQQLGNNIGSLTVEPILKRLVQPLKGLTDFINDQLEGDGIGRIIGDGILNGIANVIGGPGLIAILAVISKVAKSTFVDLTKALPAVLGITTEAQKTANIERSILNILQSQGDVAKALVGYSGNRQKQEQTLLQYARSITAEYKTQQTLAKDLAATLAVKGVTVGARGLQTGARIKAGGYIPAGLANSEKMGAFMGGYAPGDVIKSPVGGVMNTAEDIKYVAGFNQPFINPPAGSKAGRKHRSSSIARTGVDPYASFGFIPNFARPIFDYATANKSTLNAAANRGDKKAIAEIERRASKSQDAVKRPYNLRNKASMLVPDTGFFDANAQKKYTNNPFTVRGVEYDAVNFSIHGLKKNASKNLKDRNSTIADVIDNSLYTAGKSLLKAFDPEFIKGARITKNEIESLVDQAGGKGARESLKGAFFEGIIRKLVSNKRGAESLDPTSGTLDTIITKEIEGLFEGNIQSPQGDFKANKESKLRGSFATQVLKNIGAKFTKASNSLGFIPNFAYINSVMSLEEGLSGKKAIFSNNPFPHVRNASQPSFQSAVNDHGGIKKAMGDAYKNQSAAGLLSNGFIPNFVVGATGGRLNSPNQVILPQGGIQATDSLGGAQTMLKETAVDLVAQMNAYLESFKKGEITIEALNAAIDDLLKNAKTTSKSEKDLKGQINKLTEAHKRATEEERKYIQAQKKLGEAKTKQAKQLSRGFQTALPAAPQQGFLSRSAKRIGQAYDKNSVAASLVLPLAAGGVESLITRGRERSELSFGERFASGGVSSIVSGATTGALIGSVIPGFGTALGALTGGVIGATKAFFDAKETVADFNQVAQRLVDKELDRENAIQSALTAYAALEGNTATDEASVRRLNTQLDLALAALPSSVKERGITPEALKKQLNTQVAATGQIQLLTKASTLAKEANDLAGKVTIRNGRGQVTSRQLTDEQFRNIDDKRRASVDNLIAYSKSVPRVETLLKRLTGYGGKNIRGQVDATQQYIIKNSDLFENADQLARAFDVFKGNMNATEKTIGFLNEGLKKRSKEAKAKEGKATSGDLEQSATDVFIATRSSLEEASRLIRSQVSKRIESGKITDVQKEFELSLVEFLEDPIDLIRKKRKISLDAIERSFIGDEEVYQATFGKTFFNKANSFQNIRSNAQAQKDLSAVVKSTDLEEFDKFITKYSNVLTNKDDIDALREVVKLERQNIIDRKDAYDLQIEGVKQQSYRDITQQNILNRAFDLEQKIANRLASEERILIRKSAEQERAAFSRELFLQDPTNFYNKTLLEKRTLPIQMQGEDEMNALKQSQSQAFADVNKRYSNSSIRNISGYSQRINNRILLAQQEAAKNDENIGLPELEAIRESIGKVFIDLKKSSNIEIFDLESLREAIKAQEKYVSILAENDQERQGAVDTLNELKTVEEKVTTELETQNFKIQERINLQKKLTAAETTFSGGFNKAIDSMQEDIQRFPATFAENTTLAFRDGLVSAMQAAVNESDNLKDALLNVALSFAQSLQNAAFTNLANQIVVGASGKQRGGIIKAQNGMYISGGRTGDRNLALLEDGEYVLNRQAVRGLGGPRNLDALNYKTFPRFASGGRLKSGERKLSSEVNLGSMISSGGADASGSVNLSAKSDRLSSFALENEVFVKEYFDQQRQIAIERERKRKEKKAKRRAMITQFISAAVGAAAGSALSGALSGLGNAAGSTSLGKYLESGPGGTSVNPNSQAGLGLSAMNAPYKYNVGLPYNKGGYVPYGNRITDSVPAMLTGGEYVVNSRAVRKYGVGGLNSINSGIARFQDGGAVSPGGGSVETQTSSSSTSNISVNITVNNQAGGKGSSETEDVTGVGNADSKTEAEKMAKLSKQIKTVVMQVLNKEQRSGGLLDSTKKAQQ